MSQRRGIRSPRYPKIGEVRKYPSMNAVPIVPACSSPSPRRTTTPLGAPRAPRLHRLSRSEPDRHTRAEAILIREVDLRRIVRRIRVERLRVAAGRLENGAGEKTRVFGEIELQ